MSESTSGQTDSLWLWTGGLLLLIVVALSVLWMRERAAGVDAQQRLAEAQKMVNAQKEQMALQALMQQELVPAVSRGDLPVPYGQLDGRQVPIMALSAQTGQRLGLLPGDVIVVAEELPNAGDSGDGSDQP